MLDESIFLLLTSPPASGKTFWIKSYAKNFRVGEFLVLSPLRALVDECRLNWGDEIQVMTPEEYLCKNISPKVVIIDEFHLWYFWGNSFRPLMWEGLFKVLAQAHLCICLSATVSEKMLEEIKSHFQPFNQILWMNLGNREFKYPPREYIKAPSRSWILSLIMKEKNGKSVKIIFCQFRKEVKQIEKYLIQKGFNCVSCVGGEASEFKKKILTNPRPDFIIATSVLSHGVNLPEIKKIYFLSKMNNQDLWLQMVARGGRRGSPYDVYGLNTPWQLKWSRGKNLYNVIKLTLYKYLAW